MSSLTLSLIAVIVTGLVLRCTDAQGVGAHLSLIPYPNTTFKINDEVKLDCMVVNSNNAVDYQIQWYINSSLVQASSNNSEPSTDDTGVSITIINGGSQLLSLHGALKYDQTSVTCNATGIPQTLTTLLILERDILECSTASLDSGTVCFICTLSPIPQSIKITYRFSTADNNELVSTDNFTTNLGSQETPSKCIQAPALGMYDLHIYTVASFSEVSSLGNPAYVIHDITVSSISTDVTTGGTGSTVPTDSTSATDRNTHPLLTLRTWKYRVYLYVAAGLVVLAIILMLLFITTCTLVLTKKYRPVNPYDLDEIAPISNPFNTMGKNKKNKTTSKTKKTSSKNKRGGRTVTSTTTTTSRTSSGSLNSTSSSFSHTTSIELSQHRGSIQKPLETIKESDQDKVSVESMYDQLEAQPDNMYMDMQNTAQHNHDLTYEPMDEYKVGTVHV